MEYKLFTASCVCLVVGLCSALVFHKRLLYDVDDGVAVGSVEDPTLTELSGMCASRTHPGMFYTHNDHDPVDDNQNKLFVLDGVTGQVVSKVTIEGATNHDWEDIACGKCFGDLTQNCVYIGDIGDASGEGSSLIIYRVQEPDTLTLTATVTVQDTLMFSWDEEDTETLMVTPDAELYVISKIEGGAGRISHLPSIGWGASIPVDAEGYGRMDLDTDHRDPLGGDISPDGQEILIKVLDQVLHYDMNGGTDYAAVLAGPPRAMPYIQEVKGQAVAFSVDGNQYYTIGEGDNPTLYKYSAA